MLKNHLNFYLYVYPEFYVLFWAIFLGVTFSSYPGQIQLVTGKECVQSLVYKLYNPH